MRVVISASVAGSNRLKEAPGGKMESFLSAKGEESYCVDVGIGDWWSSRAPAYSRALRRIKGGFQRGVKRSSGPISRVPGGDRVAVRVGVVQMEGESSEGSG